MTEFSRAVRFRVESNRAKSTFWYTLVSGNGNTTMTSKAKYSSHAAAKRAAERQISALSVAPLAIEYVDGYGRPVLEVRNWAREVVRLAQTSPVQPGDL